MDGNDVRAWVAAYEEGWRAQDVGAVARLFTDDAVYLRGAYDTGMHGRAAIEEQWLDPTPFTMTADVVAVDPPTAVVRAEVHYEAHAPIEFRDLWVIRFADDGRAEHFEEWAHWPGMTYTEPDADGSGTSRPADEVPDEG